MFKMRTKFFALVGFVIMVSGCTPMQHVRGNFLDMDVVQKIELNKTTKGDMEALFGPPSSKELFGKDTWYYIGDKVETKSFFEPKVVERVVLMVTFGAKGTVTAFEMKDLKDHHAVDIKQEATPVKGQDPSLVSELFGNIGRYSAPKKTAKR
jgi:outer membrane protein assembly factor BamE (lipoprotein component of BamABCDE complex)